MSIPKRHHWWPEVQSSHWVDSRGFITVVNSEGSSFTAPPSKVGLEGQLYTKIDSEGEKDLQIERWFSQKIETPFASALSAIAPLPPLFSKPLGPNRDAAKEREIKELGFDFAGRLEWLDLCSEHHESLCNYIAAALVRSPLYLRKLKEFHRRNPNLSGFESLDENALKSSALDNMMYVYEVYADAIRGADMLAVTAPVGKEFLYSDAAINAQEPWNPGLVPFDIFAPLTPKLAINVLPAPFSSPGRLYVTRLNAQGVARYNRNTVGAAERFVYARANPPLDFIRRNFGIEAPAPFAHRYVNGRIETIYDRSRDRPM